MCYNSTTPCQIINNNNNLLHVTIKYKYEISVLIIITFKFLYKNHGFEILITICPSLHVKVHIQSLNHPVKCCYSFLNTI